MRFELLTSNSAQVETLLGLFLVLALLPSISLTDRSSYGAHSCIEGAEVAFHSNTSSVCLNQFELESACASPGGSLAGNPICSAVSSPDAVKQNFPLVQSYDDKTADGQGVSGGGEKEVIEGE